MAILNNYTYLTKKSVLTQFINYKISNIMKIKETVKKVLPMTSFQSKTNGDTYYQRDLILVTDEQYPKEIALTFKGANCKLLDVINPGDTVEVTFDISSRESNGRYFTTLNAWKLDIIQCVLNNAAPANTMASAVDSNLNAGRPLWALCFFCAIWALHYTISVLQRP